jgi:hypothetical protein
MGQPVVHFEVIGKDGPKLQGYYADLFGWKVDASNPMSYGIVKGEDNPSEMGSLGGTRVMGPETIMGEIELGQFKDPEGHLIGVVKGSS